MKFSKNLVSLAAVGAIAGGGLVASTGTAQAASCYGGAVAYSKAAGAHYTSMKTTSSRCNDINIKNNGNSGTVFRYVKVCFYNSDNTLNYCQSSYKKAYTDKWKAVATDVADGTKYKFRFQTTTKSTGVRAH
ncbi:hypothetical protein [Streptomyces sp. NBC_01304]|uniref:hypothetical protein n=1 Tax=Streptomyces sp. NBC_01304 TaxID=2903818 RepID=UPI002E14942E|nr:hypothetical protein OG430_20260 [Streptomyces sp. NBC_01304]